MKQRAILSIWLLLHEAMSNTFTSLVLILPKISGYAKTIKDKDGDKNKNTKMSLRINDDSVI